MFGSFSKDDPPTTSDLTSASFPNRARRAVELVAYLALHLPDVITSDRLRTPVLGSSDSDAASKNPRSHAVKSGQDVPAGHRPDRAMTCNPCLAIARVQSPPPPLANKPTNHPTKLTTLTRWTRLVFRSRCG
jgi:hypothetical protein